MVRLVIGLILHGGPIGLFLVPERVAHVVAVGFLSHYLSGPLPTGII